MALTVLNSYHHQVRHFTILSSHTVNMQPKLSEASVLQMLTTTVISQQPVFNFTELTKPPNDLVFVCNSWNSSDFWQKYWHDLLGEFFSKGSPTVFFCRKRTLFRDNNQYQVRGILGLLAIIVWPNCIFSFHFSSFNLTPLAFNFLKGNFLINNESDIFGRCCAYCLCSLDALRTALRIATEGMDYRKFLR